MSSYKYYICYNNYNYGQADLHRNLLGHEPSEQNSYSMSVYLVTSEFFIVPSSSIWNPNGKFLENATASNTEGLKDPVEIVCRLYKSSLQFLFRVLLCDS